MAPPSTPDKFPTRQMFDTIVKIEVGQAHNTFEVHKGVISFYSGFFDRAFNGNFAEGQKGVVALPEEEVGIFEHFVRWLYTRRLDEISSSGPGNATTANFQDAIKLWIFADRREIPLLMNETINFIRAEGQRTYKIYTSAPELAYAHANTTSHSALRRYFVWDVTRRASLEVLQNNVSIFPQEMLKDLFLEMAKLRFAGPSKLLTRPQIQAHDLCEFHTHEQGVKCPKQQA